MSVDFVAGLVMTAHWFVVLKGEKFGLPDAFWNLLTDSQKRILFREERFMRRR
jgi:hypothetical protein